MSNIDKHAVQAVADLKAGYTLGHADVAILSELARIALASLEAEAVATFYKSECGNVFNTLDSWLPVEGVNKLYAEPQLPQPTVPNNAATAIRACLDEFPEDVRDIVEECASIAENACRAAMLQDSEPATENTNQQFESLSRGDK